MLQQFKIVLSDLWMVVG